jgi:multidrug efflux pump subunit AcrB
MSRRLRVAVHSRSHSWRSGLALIRCGLLGTGLGTDSLPSLDKGAFELNFRLPAGTTLAETRRVAALEDVARRDPAVATDATVVGLSFAAVDAPA